MEGDGTGDAASHTRTPAGGSDGELYRRLIEYSSDLITLLEPDGTIRFTSPSVVDVLGYKQEDLMNEEALEYVHPQDKSRVQEAFETLGGTPGETAVIEYRYRTANGDYRWLETRGQNRLDDEVLDGIVVVSRDVTDRRRREGALETLHDRTREMLTAASRTDIAEITAETAKEVLDYPITVVRLLSADGTALEPVAVTDRVDDVMGDRPVYEVGEATAGRAFEKGEATVYDDLREVDDEYDRGGVRSGLFVPIGERGVLSIGDTATGALDEEDIQLARILAGNAAVAFGRLERERELERQNERLEEFASVISHDLSTPLNVAAGRLGLIDADPEHIEAIEGALDRMEELIENVLALARQGETVDETQPVELADIADQCWATVSTEDATIEIPTDATIAADPARLPEVFENLFRNAVQHGGEGVTITVGDLPEGFYVADDGPGIPEDQQDRVFDSGFSTTENGTGFGLAIVKQIAEAHGWTVSVTDSEAGGARFEFRGVQSTTGE